MNKPLAGKVALVTGGSRGIGAGRRVIAKCSGVIPPVAIILCGWILAQTAISGPAQSPSKPEEVSDAVLVFIQRGDALLKAKRYDEAIVQYKAAISSSPVFASGPNMSSLSTYSRNASSHFRCNGFDGSLASGRRRMTRTFFDCVARAASSSAWQIPMG